MTRYRFLPTLTLLSLSTLALGTVGCSQGQSPTEPAFDAPPAAKSLAASQDKRHGADDPAGDDRGGRQGNGADDPAGDDHGGRNGGQQQRPPRAGAEREGAVTAVDAGAGTLTLAGGQRIAVDGETQWDRRGDLFTLQQVADSLAAGKPTRAEARGTLRAGAARPDGQGRERPLEASTAGRVKGKGGRREAPPSRCFYSTGQAQVWIGAEQMIPQVSQSDQRQEGVAVLTPPAACRRV